MSELTLRLMNQSDTLAVMDLMRDHYIAGRYGKAPRYEDTDDVKNTHATVIDQCLTSDDHMCVVAEMDGNLVGYVTGMIGPLGVNHNSRVAFGSNLWVGKDARGSGVGGKLVDTMVVWAKRKEADYVCLASKATLSAKSFSKLLRKRGFSLDERIYSREV